MKLRKVSKAKVGGWHGSECFRLKLCAVCGKSFKPNSGAQKVCSKSCGLTHGHRHNTTDVQYVRISGNWDRYFSRLVSNTRRKISSITRKDLSRILAKQNGRCALSGVPLTCNLKKGVNFQTNASVDRKDIFKPYTLDNIWLVCKCVNSFRGTLPVKDFIRWCKKVVDHNYGKG